MKKTAIALYSGGLDSLLSIVLMKRLGHPVIPVFFKTPFFGPYKALQVAHTAGFDVRVVDITSEHLEMLKHPVYGFGRNLNPCIDCHGLMFRTAATMIENGEADFLISGEVLGQRPMSQRHDALNAVRKLSGVKDLIVRPLSQKMLPDTLPIREGWINKDDMLDIQGRTRRRQMELAEEWGITEYTTPGGGCLLTDKSYAIRLRELIAHDELNEENLRFLRLGRHFRVGPQSRFILGKTSFENKAISEVLVDEPVFKVRGLLGPMGVLQGNLTSEAIATAARITLTYTPDTTDEQAVNYGENYRLQHEIVVSKLTPEELDSLRIQ